MIDELYRLDNRAAIGVLARAALSLDDPENPAAEAILDTELALREQIFAAARAQAGLSPDDDSAAALEKIGDLLDQEADGLIGSSDMEAALRRLAERGSLPTDMYEIQINQSIADWLGKDYSLEKELLEATVRQPDQEQHFGRSAAPNEPSLASLFYRRFTTKWPFKDFNLLVVASRNGLVLDVSQAWRIHPVSLDTRNSTSLVDILRLFANKYGAGVEWEGKTGGFFLTVDTPLPQEFKYALRTSPNSNYRIAIAQIVQHQEGKATASLAVAIDLLRYVSLLSQMRVNRDEILDLPVETAHPRVAS
jgi:hypothetical protein